MQSIKSNLRSMSDFMLGPNNDTVTLIKARSSWRLVNLKELKDYRDLIYFLVWRDIKVMYAQTILGFIWAILQPLLQIVIFGVVFGKVANIPTEGIPYVLFTSIAIIPWTYMSQAMTEASLSLIGGQEMLGKVYFPRLIFPLVPVLSRMIDFGISIALLIGILAYYHVTPTWNLLLFPFFVILMMAIAAGVGLWLCAMAIRFRDIKHAMPFVIRMLIYSAPIVYSAVSIPETYRMIYSINPIVGVVEGFRACLLGTPMPWAYIWPGVVTTLVMFIGGMFYFKQMERIFVDVI